MCVIDKLMDRIKLSHDPVDKEAIDEIILLKREKIRLEGEVEKLKPFEVVAKSLVSA